jgi:hypothetical protein
VKALVKAVVLGAGVASGAWATVVDSRVEVGDATDCAVAFGEVVCSILFGTTGVGLCVEATIGTADRAAV